MGQGSKIGTETNLSGDTSPAVPHVEMLQGVTAVFASRAMRHLLSLASKVGKTDSPVLITGESGTGKEIFARVIHQQSPRSLRPLVDVNCAALPEHLVESELFGYEKGAFSGAETAKVGLFESAQAGTLFLDEIGELEPHIQAKLLRVLDGQPYFRLGGTRKVVVDARIIAATNLSLDQATRDGRFRQDLFHRLDAFHIRIPPLRERMDDLLPIAQHILRDTGLFLGSDALAIMHAYSWPGNVRELKNVLNKAAIFCSGEEISKNDLPPELFLNGSACSNAALSLEGVEQRSILQALARTGGHQGKAAELLGISSRTLIRKLKLYRGSEGAGSANLLT